MTRTVKDLKHKMTREKAEAFLQAENQKKAEKGVAILQKAVKDIQAIGCDIAVRNSINANGQILNDITVVVVK